VYSLNMSAIESESFDIEQNFIGEVQGNTFGFSIVDGIVLSDREPQASLIFASVSDDTVGLN